MMEVPTRPRVASRKASLASFRFEETMRRRSTGSDRTDLSSKVWTTQDDVSHLAPRERTKMRARYDVLSPEVAIDLGADTQVHCVSLGSGAFATGDSQGKACIWSATSGDPLASFDCGQDAKGQLVNVWSVCLQCIGNEGECQGSMLLVTGDSGRKLRLWRSDANEAVLSVSCDGDVRSVDLSPSGDSFASGDSSGALGIWDSMTGHHMCAMRCGKTVRSVSLSERLLASGDEEKRAKVWESSSGKLLFTFTCGHNVLAVEISHCEEWLATGDAMSKAKVWSLSSGKLVQTLDCGGWIYSVSFADGEFLATGDQNRRACLWDVKTAELIYSMECSGEVNSVEVSADKTTVLVGESTGKAQLWMANSGALLQTMHCGTGEVITVDLSNDHCLVATGGIGKSAMVWELQTGSLAHEVACGGMVMSVSFSRDGLHLAAGVVMGKACIYSLTDGEMHAEIPVCKGPVFCVLLKKYAGQPALVTGDVTGKAIIWDQATQAPLRTFGCGSAVRSLDISSDGSILVTGNKNGDACIWNTDTGQCVRTMACGGMVYSVDLSGDTKLLATGDQHKKARVWDVETGALVHSMPCGEVVKRVDLAGDSTMLATGAGDACHIWDLVTGTLVHSKETGGRVRLAGDKSMVVTVDGAGSMTVWSLLDPAVTSFWTPMGKHATALSSAARYMPSFELVLYGSSPSGRSIAAHAATANNLRALDSLLTGPTADLVTSTILRVDCTGWHALDYALKNRNCSLGELLLKAALRSPPGARAGLVVGPPNSPPALVVIARLFPSAVRRQFQLIGLDPYAEEGAVSRNRTPCIRRAPHDIFTLDHNKMSIAAASTPYPNTEIWERLIKPVFDESAPDPGPETESSKPPPIVMPEKKWSKISALYSAASGFQRLKDLVDPIRPKSPAKSPGKMRRQASLQKWSTSNSLFSAYEPSTPPPTEMEDVEGEDEVDAECGIVGIPKLLAKDRLIFMTLVEAAESDLDLISCDIMRAAIAFKWRAYGQRKWRVMVSKISVFFLCYITSLFLLLDSQQAIEYGTASEHADSWWWLGLLLFCVTTVINFGYGAQELNELRTADSYSVYFRNVQNACDLASFFNILLLLPLVLLHSPAAPVTGSFGTLLMLPKMAAVARGHERMSSLVTMLSEIIVDMLPFLSLMGFVILANAFAFELLSDDDGEYNSPANSWFAAYSLTLGSFSRESYQESILMTVC